MSQQEPEPTTPDAAAADLSPALETSSAASRPVSPPQRSSSPARVWAAILAAGILAGVGAWLIGEPLHSRFEVPLSAARGIPTQEEAAEAARAQATGEARAAAAAYGTLGLVLGLALGVVGGLLRGGVRTAGTAGLAGAVLGGLVGAAAPQILIPIYSRLYNPDNDDLILSIAIIGSLCGLIGAVSGAAFGYGLGGRRLVPRALVGGLLGAVAGVLIYEIVGAIAFPLDQTTRPISESAGSRLLARFAVATLTAVGAYWTTTLEPRGQTPQPPGTPV